MSRSIEQLKRFIKNKMTTSATRQFITNSDLPIKAAFERPRKVEATVSVRKANLQRGSSVRQKVRDVSLESCKHFAKDAASSCLNKRKDCVSKRTK